MLTCGHFLWQGLAVVIVFFAIERLAVARATSRYALGCAALLSLPICVMPTFAVVSPTDTTALKPQGVKLVDEVKVHKD